MATKYGWNPPVRRPHRVDLKIGIAIEKPKPPLTVVPMFPPGNQIRLVETVTKVNRYQSEVAHLKSHQAYRFKDRDPIMDIVISLLDLSEMSDYRIAADSFIAAATIKNWRNGTTKRPQAYTLRRVLQTLGYKLVVEPERSK